MHSKMFNEGKLLKEKHSGGLAGHFGQDKTFFSVSAFYFWPGMQTDVKKFVERCRVCQYAKGRSQNTRDVSTISNPKQTMGFCKYGLCVRISKNSKGNDSIYVVVDRF
jgi:hypothetical protein